MGKRWLFVVLFFVVVLVIVVCLFVGKTTVFDVSVSTTNKDPTTDICPTCKQTECALTCEKLVWPTANSEQNICNASWVSPYQLPPPTTLPKEIPASLMNAYTLFGFAKFQLKLILFTGLISVKRWLIEDCFQGNAEAGNIYSKEKCEKYITMAQNRKENYYGPTDVDL